jgi:uncharacterized protein Yka (UPF0111/DUF47 family)
MLSRLIPRDEQFFDLFNQLAEHLRTSAQLLDELFSQPARTAELVRQIKDVEHLAEVRAPARQMAHVILQASELIAKAVMAIKRPREVGGFATQIKLLEEEGDALYHEAVGALFAGTPDPIEVIRWKEVYETLEQAIDQCMGVANAVHSISIKNS